MKIDETDRGKRVELIFTDDPYTDLKPGAQGTYQHKTSHSPKGGIVSVHLRKQ